MENNKNKRSMKFQGDMFFFCDFIQVFVFTRNHLKLELVVFIFNFVRTCIFFYSVCHYEVHMLRFISCKENPLHRRRKRGWGGRWGGAGPPQ